jgi:uncharacterized protein HemX
MRTCPNGHENPDDKHFCGECGASIAPVASVPGTSGADWGADPTGRHEYRYWDGSVWTEHVADQGTTSSDPLSETDAAQAPAPVAAVGAAPSVPASSVAASAGPVVAGAPGTTAAGAGPEVVRKRPSNLVIGLLTGVIVVLVAVGIFGFTRPPSNDAKQKGDQVAQQLAAAKNATAAAENATKAAQTPTASIRAAVDKLSTLDAQEATAGTNVINEVQAAVARFNGGDTGAFAAASLRSAVDNMGAIISQEKALLTEVQQTVTQAQGVK